MNNYSKALLNMVDDLLSNKYDVTEFRSNYYDFYLEEVPENVLSHAEFEFFDSIQEKLDWVDLEPDEVSRKYGWIDCQEFMDWLKNKRMNWFRKT